MTRAILFIFLGGLAAKPCHWEAVEEARDSGKGASADQRVLADSGREPAPGADAVHAPVADAAKPPPVRVDKGTPVRLDSGTPAPVAGTLPTVINLDWSGFPKDPGPNYAVRGKVWVVKATGNDSNAGTDASPLRTISHALSAASAGDLVRVHAGTYVEPGPYMITKSIVLTAAAGEQVTVAPVSSQYKRGLTIAASDVVLNGINFRGFIASIQLGANDAPQKNVVISNLTIQGPDSDVYSEGINAYYDTTARGFPTSDGVLFKNVSVLGVGMGISCNSGPCKSWRFENVKVEGRGGTGSGADAIAVETGDNLLFYNVDVSRVAADGIDTKATRVVVWNCASHDLARNGIKLWHGGDIVNTIVHHTGADAAVVIAGGPRVRLLHSTIVYHNWGADPAYSLTLDYRSGEGLQVDVINSIIAFNSGGIYARVGTNLKFQNTLFHETGNLNILEFGDKGVIWPDGAGALTEKGLGTGNLFATPLLDAAYHQRSGSPTINKGVALSSLYPATDKAGQSRVKEGAPDLGAFEDF